MNRIKVFIYRLLNYQLDPSVIISSSAKIIGNINVTVGRQTFIGHETLIMGGLSNISIGSYVDISSRVNIVTGTHEVDMVNIRTAGKGIGRDVTIEDGVWVGFGVTILPGVTIGYKSIIGAGSVVVDSIPPYSIAVGNPCKVIKRFNPKINTWERNVI
jgi:maltose O-acetyltransferase